MIYKSISELSGIPLQAYIKNVNFIDGSLFVKYQLSSEESCVLIFDNIAAYRVLLEADTRYLLDINLSNGFIFEITEGGWVDESNALDFTGHDNITKEFFILGELYCLSVLCNNKPHIMKSD